jgi:CBS domain containing-hemolysin-like protein
VGILLLEALGFLGVGALFLSTLAMGDLVSVGGTVFLAVFLILLAIWLGVLARALWRGFRWPRSAALVIQLFLVILSVSFFSSGSVVIGLAMLVPGAVVLIALFTRPVLNYTSRTTGETRTL